MVFGVRICLLHSLWQGSNRIISFLFC
jgi:hypothetical protein